MAEQFLPYDGSKAKFVLPLIDNGGGTVTLTPLRPGQGLVLPTFTRTGPATTVLASGLIGGVASGAARSYYDPTTLAYLGYLAEGARTNEVLRSAEFDNASWTKVNVTVGADAAVAPDGTTTAETLTATAAAATTIVQANTVATTGAYTYSIFVKQGSGATEANSFILRNATSATILNNITFNYSTGVVSQITGTGATSKQHQNGWWRLTLPVAAGSITAGDSVQVYVGFTGNAEGAGESLIAWGAQLEPGAFASSYIPTTVSTVTRNADVLTYPSSPWFNAATGTIFASGTPFSPAGSPLDQYFISIDDGTLNERHFLYRNFSSGTSGGGAVDGGVVQANMADGALTSNASNKAAYAYATNDFALVANGGTVVTDAAGTLPTVTTATIGSTVGVAFFFGAISSIAYFDNRLPNNDLLYMTTHGVDFEMVTPAPSGGSSRQTSIPAAFNARGPTQEQKRKSRVKFGLEKEVEQVIERVAENQAERQERDKQKQFEQLTRELEISGIEYEARYLDLLSAKRERLIQYREDELKRVQEEQESLAMIIQVGQQAINQHYGNIAQRLQQFAAESEQINKQFIEMLQTFDQEYRAELVKYVPADLIRRRR